MRPLFLLSLIFFYAPVFPQTKYYFAFNAKRTGNGTIQRPFTSIDTISKLNLQPGDTVFFHGGDVFRGSARLENIHGTFNKPVVFTSYGKGKAKIFSGNKEGLVISGSDHISINNLVVTGSGRKEGNTTDGLKLANCDHVRIKNVETNGFQKSGLLLFNCSNAEINGVIATNNGATGILIEGDYQKRLSQGIHITGCRADNNPGDPTNLTNHSGNGILVGNCRNVLIEYCTATNNGWDMPRIGNGPVGIWAYEADSIIIQHCISYRNKTAKGAADGGGFDLDGGVTNSIIQYCLSYENQGSGYGIFQYWSASKWKNNTLRYCISINDGKVTENASGLYIWNGNNGDSTFTDFYAYNNFFYNDAKYAISFAPESQHRHFRFFNNVFIASDTSDIYFGVDSNMTDVFLGNAWAGKYGGFIQKKFIDPWQWTRLKSLSMDAASLFGYRFNKRVFNFPKNILITDPKRLASDPLLKRVCNPVLLNKGIDIRKMLGIDPGKRDFFGNPVPKGVATEPGVCEMK